MPALVHFSGPWERRGTHTAGRVHALARWQNGHLADVRERCRGRFWTAWTRTTPQPSTPLADVPQGDLRLLNDPTARTLLGSTEMAHLAYAWRDGTPRCTAIWFHWNGEQLVVVSPASAPKSSVIETGTAVAVTIDDAHFAYTSLNLRGTAWVDQVDGVADEYRRAAVRYLGADAGASWCEQLPADVVMTRIAVEPDWVGLIDLADGRRLPSALAG